MFTIAEFNDPRIKATPMATVESIDAAEAFLAEKFDVLVFERDEVEGGADAMVLLKGSKHSMPIQIAINPAR